MTTSTTTTKATTTKATKAITAIHLHTRNKIVVPDTTPILELNLEHTPSSYRQRDAVLQAIIDGFATVLLDLGLPLPIGNYKFNTHRDVTTYYRRMWQQLAIADNVSTNDLQRLALTELLKQHIMNTTSTSADIIRSIEVRLDWIAGNSIQYAVLSYKGKEHLVPLTELKYYLSIVLRTTVTTLYAGSRKQFFVNANPEVLEAARKGSIHLTDSKLWNTIVNNTRLLEDRISNEYSNSEPQL